MKLTIEATAQELHDKGEQLIRAMTAELAAVRPDLAEQLTKALEVAPMREWRSNAAFPALRDIEEHTNQQYLDMLDGMLRDIYEVLDEKPLAIQKAHEWHARERVIERLVRAGAQRDDLARLSLGELLQKAATLP